MDPIRLSKTAERKRHGLSDEPLQNLVRVELIRAILDGRYRPGESLSISGLARQLEVSTIPVREALRGLEAQGIVTFETNRGAVVADLSPKELDEVFLLRRTLECLAIEHAIPNLDESHFSVLESHFEQMAHAESDPPEWLSHNHEFHLTIYAASHLPRLQSMIMAVAAVSRPYIGLYLAHRKDLSKAAGEHEAILEACRRRDVDAAVRVLAEHIGDTRDTVMSAMLPD